MLYPINEETKNMSQALLEAYYEGANSASNGGTDNPHFIFESPTVDIASAFRKGHAAQLAAMAQDSSLV